MDNTFAFNNDFCTFLIISWHLIKPSGCKLKINDSASWYNINTSTVHFIRNTLCAWTFVNQPITWQKRNDAGQELRWMFTLNITRRKMWLKLRHGCWYQKVSLSVSGTADVRISHTTFSRGYTERCEKQIDVQRASVQQEEAVWAESKAMITQISTLYKHGEQKSISELTK